MGRVKTEPRKMKRGSASQTNKGNDEGGGQGDFSPAQTPKRGRGRPRKSTVEADSVHESFQIDPSSISKKSKSHADDEKPPRGSTRKGRNRETTQRETSSVTSKLQESPQSLRQSSPQPDSSLHCKDTSATPSSKKRRHGRPKKGNQESDTSINTEDHIDGEMSSGKTLNKDKVDKSPKPVTEKRKKGRPPKTTAASDVPQDESAVELEAPDADVKKINLTSKRKGRPSKSVLGTKRNLQGKITYLKSGKVSGGKKVNPVPDTNSSPTLSQLAGPCIHCDAQFTKISDFKDHLMKKHHRVWTVEKPDGTYSPIAVLRTLRSISCLKCDKHFNQIGLFHAHNRFCGLEDATQFCEICKKDIKIPILQRHMRNHKLAAESSHTKVSGSGRASRKAAQRAIEHLHKANYAEDVGEQDLEAAASEEEEDEYQKESGSDTDTDVTHLANKPKTSNSPRTSNVPRTKGYNISKGVTRPEDAANQWPYFSYEAHECDIPTMEQDTLRWYTEHECTDLFPKWLPYAANYRPAHLGDKCDSSAEVISRSHGEVQVGSIVWRVAWCPLPVQCDTIPTSYLAVSHNVGPGSGEDVETISPSLSCIQLWSCGHLEEGLTSLELSYSISVDEGRVWDMKWCPTGAWQPHVPAKHGQPLARLGLLAVALSTGQIQLLSLAHPDQLLKTTTTSASMYSVRPSISLARDLSGETGVQCLCIDWSRLERCGQICAGFSDGIICVWRLDADSPLLDPIIKDHQAMLPVHSFQAHLGAVTCITMCPNSQWFMASGSVAKDIRIWDVRELSQPMEEFISYRMTSVVWPLNWFSVVFASDNVDCHGNNHVMQVTYGVEATNRPLLVHSACVWSVDYSPWHNTIVSCDNAGRLSALSTKSTTGKMTNKEVVRNRMCWIMKKKDSLVAPNYVVNAKDKLTERSEEGLHCVVWNPNYGRHRWLACGGTQGKVFIKQSGVHGVIE